MWGRSDDDLIEKNVPNFSDYLDCSAKKHSKIWKIKQRIWNDKLIVFHTLNRVIFKSRHRIRVYENKFEILKSVGGLKVYVWGIFPLMFKLLMNSVLYVG